MIKTKQQAADLVLVVLTVIVGIISYILNLGWIRVIFIIPFLAYNTIILISGIIYVLTSRKEGAVKQRKAFYLGLLTYILFNVFLFDGGDIGPAYCFFGLIKIYGSGSFFYYTSMISLIISLICIILNIKAIMSKKAEV
ncbi:MULTISPECIES: hypothetical protein [Clostridium]|uniref:Uncharacterized protein n=1 Tax=Clostridium beijerinckii TaxID=1520 RepID=A0AAE5H309_CLOBE|nr:MULTISPECIES: hypothetical protein [Clostridium]MBE6091025.1 hypothetical protein [Clostridium beijerinckii]NSB13859.1 hypothetical protein [Clostridium beijerinckii]OOM25470.1 hypothetical protein CLOBE_35370 [Clostridium beijerinckii]